MTGSIRELLFTDFDGRPVDDPDDVITEAFDDPRYLERISPLQTLLNSPSTQPYDRFLACCALASWGERAGYLAVADAAARSRNVDWYGVLTDNRYSVDETFSHLAGTIYLGKDWAGEKDTEQDRLFALRALLSIADEQYFDWRLAFALDTASLPHVIDMLPEVVRRGIQRFTDGPKPLFDLGVQLADLIAAITTTDETLAVKLGTELVRVDTSVRTIIHLAAIVSRGKTPISANFADHLNAIGEPASQKAIREALSERR